MIAPNVLLVDDEKTVRDATAQSLLLAGYEVQTFSRAADALPLITAEFEGVIISDIRMPEMDGLEFLQQVLRIDRDLPVILISGHADVATAVSAIRNGGYDLLEKPFSNTQLVEVLKRASDKRRLTLENRALKEALANQTRPGPRIIGQTPAIMLLRKMITRIANVNADVLVMGETGTGKELVARSIHEQSQRRDHNYVAINCAAIPASLLDSELFGHEAGAFTGAKGKRIGKFEHANGGTLFLDEIEGMPLTTQAPLLRVLQERQIERLGSNKLIPLDIRVIAATKVDLKDAAERAEFRRDLYYRLNVVTLEITPLRARREDIPLLFQHFVLIAAARCETEVPPLNSRALHVLMGHDWPGNIRELRNIAERYVLLGEAYNFDLATLMNAGDRLEGLSLTEQVACFEKTLIVQALNHHQGNTRAVMDALDVPRKTLTDKMKKYGLEREQFRE
ncbi:sigma-54-dependent transcriptional regulator [Thiothrix subterranea]|uniref:Sigma-54 dependent transcriptional regulator n=1 Tax=Thiothrix subterranea TaxID=2735563 RepID=A0AA51MRJ7_9GAMM|nr:sigma-54 dependent transcriptional regulator [Thiothrix subterranea]WML88016.1 sigma-54 dependent transcriptional regulator [Thiothrix subterranea]